MRHDGFVHLSRAEAVTEYSFQVKVENEVLRDAKTGVSLDVIFEILPAIAGQCDFQDEI